MKRLLIIGTILLWIFLILINWTTYYYYDYEEIHSSLPHDGKLDIHIMPLNMEQVTRIGKNGVEYRSPYTIRISFEYPIGTEGAVKLISVDIKEAKNDYHRTFANIGMKKLFYSPDQKMNIGPFILRDLDLPYNDIIMTLKAEMTIKDDKTEVFEYTTTIHTKYREELRNNFVDALKSV